MKAGVCLSLTHCNVSTFLSGSANLAASLSNFSWQQPRKNRRGKSTRAGALDDCRESAALVRAFFASPHSRSSSSFFFFFRFSSVRFPTITSDHLSVSSRKTRGITARARKKCVDRFLSRLPFGAHTVKRAAIGCVIHDICAPDGSACLMKIL